MKLTLLLLAAMSSAQIKVVLQSTNGTQTCPAQSMQWDSGVVTIAGLACPPDTIFKNGFEL